MRHTAMVPKGFIRYQVLESLNGKPMSGSEIINEIESRTDRRWKPSPGSVYPLLAWLQDNGHVKELPTDQSGMKRYELTKSGKALLEEQRKIMDEQRKRIDEERKAQMDFMKGPSMMFGPPFVGALWSRLPPEKMVEIHDTMDRFVMAMVELGGGLGKHFSEKYVDESLKILNDAAEKLEDINRRMKVEKK
jgi:DNA-binding PadR family transcriptional regulator